MGRLSVRRKRLRKKALIRAKFTKNMPQGLKPTDLIALPAPFDPAQGRLSKPCSFKTEALIEFFRSLSRRKAGEGQGRAVHCFW
jgi:hypothetical protein